MQQPSMLPWIMATKYSEISGLTSKAIYQKIQNGVWTENVHCRQAPDRRLFVTPSAIADWLCRR
jgi:hypothetical protein